MDRILRHWFDSDWRQREDIDEVALRQRRERRQARRARSAHRKRIEALEDEVEELAVVVEALAHLFIEQGPFDAEGLQALMRRIRERRHAEEEARTEAEAEDVRAKAPKPTRKRR